MLGSRAFIILGILFVSLANVVEAKESRNWDFDSDTAGKPASGFRTGVGEWMVAKDGQNNVLAQNAQNADSVFNRLFRPDVLYSDLELSVRLKAVKGIVDQGGGLVWRVKNLQTYYLARFNPLEDSFRVYKVSRSSGTVVSGHSRGNL